MYPDKFRDIITSMRDGGISISILDDTILTGGSEIITIELLNSENKYGEYSFELTDAKDSGYLASILTGILAEAVRKVYNTAYVIPVENGLGKPMSYVCGSGGEFEIDGNYDYDREISRADTEPEAWLEAYKKIREV